MRQQKLPHCLNCRLDLSNKENFCPNCGQKNHATQLSIRSLCSDLFHAIFNTDARLWITLKSAFLKIGNLVKEFNQGKRKKYVGPVQFYLFCSVLYFLLLSLEGQMNKGLANAVIKETIATKDSIPVSLGFKTILLTKVELQALPNYSNQQVDALLQKKQVPVTFYNRLILKQGVKVISEDIESVNERLNSIISTGMFLLMPIVAWLLYLFFKSIYPYYIEHLIFSVYFHSIAFLFLGVDVLLRIATGVPYLKLVILIGLLIYAITAIKQFYEFNWPKTIGYSLLLSMLYSIILAIFLSIVVLISLLIS